MFVGDIAGRVSKTRKVKTQCASGGDDVGGVGWIGFAKGVMSFPSYGG
jgi:hypothetical protein